MDPPSRVNHLSHQSIYEDFVSSNSERKSGFQKWFSEIFRGGFNQGRGGGHLQQPAEENMVWRSPTGMLDDRARAQKEKEDPGHAIPPSSSKDLKKPTGYYSTATDEDYSKADNESLNSSARPPYARAPFYPGNNIRICGGCNHEILHGNHLEWMRIPFFIQTAFAVILVVTPLLSVRHPYHKSCFKELTHPKCEVCHQFIPINAAGLIECRCHPFWSQRYCPSHDYDNTARCCSCERLESCKAKYYRLEDGRFLCLECMESAIMDTGHCQPLYHAIRDFYEGMYMRIDQQFPMILVERKALNEAIDGEKNGSHHLPETTGLCLSEEQTVTSILRRPRIGGHRLVGMRTQPQKLTKKCEVTAILVLYGLPRLLTGAILAHELMHAWLRLKGYRYLDPQVEEGICQVLSYMWLESEVIPSSVSSSSSRGAKSQVENKLGEYFTHQIAHGSSPVYGGGFRAANAAVTKYGLRCTLDHVRLTGCFPH